MKQHVCTHLQQLPVFAMGLQDCLGCQSLLLRPFVPRSAPDLPDCIIIGGGLAGRLRDKGPAHGPGCLWRDACPAQLLHLVAAPGSCLGSYHRGGPAEGLLCRSGRSSGGPVGKALVPHRHAALELLGRLGWWPIRLGAVGQLCHA